MTGFSPFELLYGVKENKFINYVDEELKEEEEVLVERSVQLKKLVEGTRRIGNINIEKQKEVQMHYQDLRSGKALTEEVLKIGTRVMLKVEGLRGKLEPKYHGRFTIAGITRTGNYKLENAAGDELKQSWPITKLKPIREDENKPEESAEIEKIMDKRKNTKTKKIEYLVRWKECDESEDQWIAEELFDEILIKNISSWEALILGQSMFSIFITFY